jgi:predicted lysophospholipase L1 biosynthesis ABC-type transport system permease subunit
LIGLAGAWSVVTFVLEADWALDPVLVATIVVAAAAAFALAGLMTGLAAMRQSPARVLAAAAELR